MKKSQGIRLFNFGIPALKSNTGMMTCPQAGSCAKYCYARKGTYKFPVVDTAYERRLQYTKLDSFHELMNYEIAINKVTHLRIHDSGDFYDSAYLNKWLKIINENKHVQFYAYTKQVRLFQTYKLLGYIPDNFTVIYSLGGKEDDRINVDTERHSKIFKSLDDLIAAGYSDASNNDLIAMGDNHKIGLLAH